MCMTASKEIMVGFVDEKNRTMREEARFSELPPFPRVMLLEPANACNLRCVFCGNGDSGRKPALLDLGRAEKILADAHGGGAREVGLYRTGEPFLHPRLHELAALARDIGYEYIYVTTNGALATPEKVERLIAHGLNSIKFSINAGDRESYRRIHGVDAFDTALANLEACLRLRDQSPVSDRAFHRVMVSSVYDNQPDPALLALRDRLAGRVDDFHLNPSVDFSGKRSEFKCVELFNRLNVTAEGWLSACCTDFGNDLLISNLRHESIVQAWGGECFRNLRRRFLQRSLDGTLCGRCLYGCADPVVPLAPSAGECE